MMLWELVVWGNGKERQGGIMTKHRRNYMRTDKTLGSPCSDQSGARRRSLVDVKSSVSNEVFSSPCSCVLNRGGMLCALWKAITDFRDTQT